MKHRIGLSLLTVFVAFNVLRRAGNYGFSSPGREVLFTVISAEDKYKAKNFIDTFVYRTGDQIGAWTSAFLATASIEDVISSIVTEVSATVSASVSRFFAD